MKKALLYAPVVLSLLVLGAHFLRYDNWIGVSASLVLVALLAVRQPWVARLMQVVLVLGALEWLRTLHSLTELRITHDQPMMRMAIILGTVAITTGSSSLLFQSATLRGIYRIGGPAGTNDHSSALP